MSSSLTSEQEAFVREFLVDLNSTEAAVRIGIDRSAAKGATSKLLRDPGVLASIGDRLVKKSTQTVSATRLLRDVLQRKLPARMGAARLLQLIAARRGIAISRLPNSGRKPGADTGNGQMLHVHHKGNCFYCRADGPIARHLLRGEEWDSHFKKILHEVSAGSGSGLVVEVGANIGASFVPECRELPHMTFVLIEPLPSFFELLEKNARSFGVTNAELRNVAVSNGTANEVVLIHDTNSAGVAAAGSIVGQHGVAVAPSQSLDEMFPTERVTLLKVDVDGYEGDVFEGGQALIGRSRPHVLFEFFPRAMEVRGIEPMQLPRILERLGVDRFDVYRKDGMLVEAAVDASRVWTLFEAMHDALGYVDVHAYPRSWADR